MVRGLYRPHIRPPETARSAFATARAIVEKQLRDNPDNGLTWALLGEVKAALGEKQEAIEPASAPANSGLYPESRVGVLELSDISR